MRYITALLFLLASGVASAATVEFNLSWSAPSDGGPVTDYAVVCEDSGGAVIVDLATDATTATATATGVPDGAGVCSLVARGPGGESPAVLAGWSVETVAPPGAPTDFTVTFNCTIDGDGQVTCEQA